MRAIAYLRVSSVQQAQGGVSLADQRDRAKAWAVAHGFDLIDPDIFEDAGLSGWKRGGRDRPAFNAAMIAAERADAFVVYSLTRFGRSVPEVIRNAEHLHNCGTEFVSLSESIDTTTAVGKLTFNVLAALGQFYSDQKSEQMRECLASRKASGKRFSGHPPFGWKHVDGMLVSVPAEQAARERIISLNEDGLTWIEIASTLEPSTSRSGTWWPAQIGRILKYEPPA